jgi:hypothetical protein
MMGEGRAVPMKVCNAHWGEAEFSKNNLVRDVLPHLRRALHTEGSSRCCRDIDLGPQVGRVNHLPLGFFTRLKCFSSVFH